MTGYQHLRYTQYVQNDFPNILYFFAGYSIFLSNLSAENFNCVVIPL